FTHFMQVFVVWVGVVTAPLTLSILANLGFPLERRVTVFGVVCLVVASIGMFLAAKMFDIRRSQLRYLGQINTIRVKRYSLFNVTEATGLRPYGEGVNLANVAAFDFGMSMAKAMGFVHSV